MMEIFQPNILFLNGKKVQQFYEKYVEGTDYSSSKKIIEKQLINKGIFTNKPFKVKSYAARGVKVTLEAKVIKESIESLYRSSEKTSLSSHTGWKESELILALDFYLHHRNNIPSKDSKEIQDLASNIRDLDIHSNKNLELSFRNEDDVHQKLMNFLNLDTGGDEGMNKVIISNLECWSEFIYQPYELISTARYINLLRDNYVSRY